MIKVTLKKIMSLKTLIEKKLNQALKDKDKNTYPTLRLVVSAIKDAEIANRTKEKKDMSDSDIMIILKKMIKQRNESCEVYKKAGRTELLDNETKEINVINAFLPNFCLFSSCGKHFSSTFVTKYRILNNDDTSKDNNAP